MFIVKSTYVEHPIGKILLAATSIASAVVLIRHYAYRSAIAAVRVRNHVCRNRAICSKSANKFRSLRFLISRDESVLCALACLEFKSLVLCLERSDLVLSQEVKDCAGVAVVVFQNISRSVLDGVSGIASLCCQIVVCVSKAFFNGSLSVAAILLSYRLFILYICRFPRQFGLYLHPIATIGAGYSCRDYWLSVLTR